MAADYKQAYVRLRSKTTREWFVHPELRAKVIDDADRDDTTANEVILRILHQRFGVPYEAKPAKVQGPPNPDFFNFRMPLSLFLVINAQYPSHYQDGVRQALCAHYALPMPEQQKLPRARTAAAA